MIKLMYWIVGILASMFVLSFGLYTLIELFAWMSVITS